MECKVSGKNLVIKLPIDTLVMAFNEKEDNQDAYQVKCKRKFAEGLCEYLLNHGDDSETGLTTFQAMLDRLFDEMAMDGHEAIKELEDPDY